MLIIAILIFHIAVALCGLGYAVYLFFYPSQKGLKLDYGLLTATIVSGSLLIALKPAHITQTCVEGLAYIGLILAGVSVVRRKLSLQKIKQ